MKTILWFNYFTAAIIITFLCGLVYVTVQQVYRTSANDPQLQIARDLKEEILQGKTYLQSSAFPQVDLQKSLSTFIQFYNADEILITSTGVINTKHPAIPHGVLEEAKRTGENAVTWQPTEEVRLASVTEYIGSADAAYVVVARSLKETEEREANLVKTVFICWIVCIGILTLHSLIHAYYLKSKEV